MNRSFGIVKASAIHKSTNPNADSLIVRQQVTTTYPGARGSNSKSSALFGDNSFGEGQSFTNERVAFIKVPKGTTLAVAKKKLQEVKGCGHIYRVMSHDVTKVATAEQLAMRTIEELKESLEAKNPATGETMLHNGLPFYRATYWANKFVEDIDDRNTVQPVAAKQPVASEVEDLQ